MVRRTSAIEQINFFQPCKQKCTRYLWKMYKAHQIEKFSSSNRSINLNVTGVTRAEGSRPDRHNWITESGYLGIGAGGMASGTRSIVIATAAARRSFTLLQQSHVSLWQAFRRYDATRRPRPIARIHRWCRLVMRYEGRECGSDVRRRY